ncbi:MAG: hypothetical protein DI533_08550 [Cereibacter sphaeroides]|uniref:CHAD domain-containing protein n=1 Tax=Cereibacter sphaeroides TaxID=1063 RepID=A0A2W5UB20_CERSP|nr:MAG: hypothetical protein DI533_08550 [Cereibacter sphaeroides]
MPFSFDTEDRSLEAALRRIAGHELDAAVAQIARPGPVPAAGIHDIRKRIKKLRGLLRLLRPGFAEYAVENAALRDAGQHLSGQRDAEVRLATFDRLFPEPTPALLPFRHHLSALRDEAHSTPGGTADATGILLDLRQRATAWTLKGKDRSILQKGLSETRRRAIATLEDAQEAPEIDPMHEWRKRAKDHWYQARLLTPIWPEVMAPIANAASDLTEDLGDHHDLGVLVEHGVTVAKQVLTAAALRQLTKATTAAQRKIEARAFPLGHRIFAGDPDQMARLWVEWWHHWRG